MKGGVDYEWLVDKDLEGGGSLWSELTLYSYGDTEGNHEIISGRAPGNPVRIQMLKEEDMWYNSHRISHYNNVSLSNSLSAF